MSNLNDFVIENDVLTKYKGPGGDVVIPDSVVKIGNDAFRNCFSLKNVVIPESVTSIGNGAFKGCKGLADPDGFIVVRGILFDYIGSGGDIVIPDGVTEIDRGSFLKQELLRLSGNSSLTSVTIPEGVKSIGIEAFRNCTGLRNVLIPKSVTSIGNGAFKGCKGLADQDGFVIRLGILFDYFGPGGDVVIPEDVKTIGPVAFLNRADLTSVTIPESVTSIGNGAFKGCKGLANQNGFVIKQGILFDYSGSGGNVEVPDGVTLISNGAFGVTRVENVTISEGVTGIGLDAFKKCVELKSVTIPDSVTSIGKRAFLGCAVMNSISIPAGITSIGSEAFKDCCSLMRVTISKNLKTIGKDAFSNCLSLREVHICDLAAWCKIHFDGSGSNPLTSCRARPELFLNGAQLRSLDFSEGENLSVIKNLQHCHSLASAVIPEGVTSIGNEAFEYCSSLKTVTIPDSVTNIGKNAFYHCGSLTSVTIPDNVTSIGDNAFRGCAGLADPNGFLILCKKLLGYFGSGGDVVIPEGVISIDSEAFKDCSSLKSVTIPEGITSIGKGAFSGCEALTSVTIPDSVTSIGQYAFFNCTKLERARIPSGVTSLGDNAFWNCKSLTSVTIPGGVTSISESAFSGCENLTDVTICEGVMDIGKEAFRYCKKLKVLTLPSSMIHVETEAFWACDALEEVHIQDCAAWCRIRFSGKDSNPFEVSYLHHPTLLLNEKPVTEISFPEVAGGVVANLSNIKSLRKVTIPVGVTEIEAKTFSGCENLETVLIPESVWRIGTDAFSGCKSLKNVTLPESVREIGGGAFQWCGSLKSLIIPKNVTSIGAFSFSRCVSITNITIPESVMSIGDQAFSGCANLSKVLLPKKLQKIGQHVFNSCPALTECDVPASIKEWSGIPAAYADGVYYTENEGKKEILEIFAPGSEEFKVPAWATKIRENALAGTPLKKLTVSAGTIIDENALGKFFSNRSSIEFTGDFLETRKELPTYYIPFFEKAVKTPEVLAYRMLFQSGIKWNEVLTSAAQSADKSEIIRAMANLVEGEAEEKLAAKFADNVLDYLEELGKDEMTRSYEVLRNGKFKALRKLVLDEAFQNKWFILPEQEEVHPIEKTVKDNWKTTEAVKKLQKAVKEGIHLRNSDIEVSPNVIIFIVNEYASQLVNPAQLSIGTYQSSYVRLKISELADQIAAELDTEELRGQLEKLAYIDKTFRNGFVLALARYGSGKQVSHLCSQMRERANWGSHGVAGRQDVIIARSALMLSETREAMMALDKDGTLDAYAAMRNTDADTIRDTVLSDFGFDQAGKKSYNLGGNKVSVSMAQDLTLQLFDENAGKTTKSMPKKNADPMLFEAAKADFSDLKKNIKRVIKHRRDVIFDDFLSGIGRDAVNWKKIYLSNPVLLAVAKLIVWEQNGITFTLTDTGAINRHGNSIIVEDNPSIRVAHPIEMNTEEIKEWQDYFVQNNLKQPFEQIWEPVYDQESIAPDRYEGSVLPIYRFENKSQHGIHSWGLTAYSEDYGFKLEDCELDADGSTWRIIPGETDDETYTLGQFKLIKHTRKSNHIIFILDKWTIVDRIEKDDDSIGLMLPSFTIAQITEFIRIANEKQRSKVLAVLLDYKNKKYKDADPFAEFTLD